MLVTVLTAILVLALLGVSPIWSYSRILGVCPDWRNRSDSVHLRYSHASRPDLEPVVRTVLEYLPVWSGSVILATYSESRLKRTKCRMMKSGSRRFQMGGK